MRKEIIHTGTTEEEAINSACYILGVPREECEWEIIERARTSFFGLRKVPARVRVWTMVEVEEVVEEKPVKKEKVAEPVAKVFSKKEKPVEPREAVKKQEVAKKVQEPKTTENAKVEAVSLDELDESALRKVAEAKSYLGEILKGLGLEADITERVENGGVWLSITGKGLGAIIGRRGETLNALQYLTSLAAGRLDGEYLRITVDAGDYRLKRNKSLEEMAERIAKQVVKTDISRTLEPMTPAERRIIHSTVSNIEGVNSISVGNEPYRKVVIRTLTSKSRPERKGGRDGDRVRRDRDDSRSSRPPRRNDERPQSQAPTGEPIITPETKASTPLYGKIELD